jgi:hypothetical protein
MTDRRGPEIRMRRAFRLPLLSLLCLLAAAGCDKLRIPAPPSASAGATPAAPAAPARKGAGAKRQPKPDAALDAPRFDQIRRGLRRLVVAEENYFAENGAYTEDLTRIGFSPEGESAVRFLWLSRGGWAASGTHPGVPGRDCVIYVGRAHGAPTTLRDVRSGREGVPVCDALPGPRAHRDTLSRPPVETPARASVPDTGSALDAVNPSVQMRVDLRNLGRSQDTYYGLQGVYSRRTEPFALQYLWHRGVSLTILTADSRSWSAKATHAARPGKSCVIWFGPVPKKPATERQQRVPEQPATPVCDE